MKKILSLALAAALLILCLAGCSRTTDVKIIFYAESVLEFSGGTAAQTRALTVSEVKRIRSILAGAEWVDDRAVNRFPFYFDGEFRIDGVLYRFSFTEPYPLDYSHYYDVLSAEDVAFLRSLCTAK